MTKLDEVFTVGGQRARRKRTAYLDTRELARMIDAAARDHCGHRAGRPGGEWLTIKHRLGDRDREFREQQQ